jgi:hypothetical protein
MADAEENYWGLERRRREEKKRAAERKRDGRAGRNLAGLKREAAKQVKKNSEKLAEVLMGRALKGHVASAKLVVQLAEQKKTDAEPKIRRRREPSMARWLALQPQWEDPAPEPPGPQWWEVKREEGTGDGGDEGTGSRQ